MHSVVRPGRISSVDYKRGCADVVFDGSGGNIKEALPFLSFEYDPPHKGDMVLVVFEQFDKREQGFIIGKYFNSSCLVPGGLSKGDYFKRFSGNSYIKFSNKDNTLVLSAGGINISADIQSGVLTLSAKKVVINEG
ncbi:MAG: hypothetical protein K1W06_11285 [Lachnospiraceae bacterium]